MLLGESKPCWRSTASLIGPRPGRAGQNGRVEVGRSHGPLPGLLVGLTMVTGLVDAFSFLRLEHVFVANMTGNVIFLGFGLAGVGDIAVLASLVAILAFAIGAAIAGRWASPRVQHRGDLLAAAVTVQSGLVVAAALVAESAGVQGAAARLWMVGLLAVAMGGQNAIARRLAVPDFTTTVLTMTVTGLVADTTSWPVRGRRVLPIVAMLAGAFAGGALLRWVSTAAPLWLAAAILLGCAGIAHLASRRPGSFAWR